MQSPLSETRQQFHDAKPKMAPDIQRAYEDGLLTDSDVINSVIESEIIANIIEAASKNKMTEARRAIVEDELADGYLRDRIVKAQIRRELDL